jgi:hypothetical protein
MVHQLPLKIGEQLKLTGVHLLCQWLQPLQLHLHLHLQLHRLSLRQQLIHGVVELPRTGVEHCNCN